jgi:micrococcal nuclease
VNRVIDGDTIEVIAADGRAVRVRLEGVDCPERRQPFTDVARNFTRQLIFDQVVEIRPFYSDRNGRLVARVVFAGKDVSIELTRAGLAWHFTEYSSDQVLAASEQLARKERRGLWTELQPIPPWVARRRANTTVRSPLLAPAAPSTVHGNTRSRVYHSSTCSNYKCRNCTVVFEDAAAARAAGFRPAGDCLK